jgi:hypothetical protein
MRYGQNTIKKICLAFMLVILSAGIHAQQSDEDSIKMLSEDIDSVVDTVPSDEVTEDEVGVVEEPPPPTQSVWFLQKGLQSSGGGPDSLQTRKLPDSILQKLQNDDAFWYVNYVFEKEKAKKYESPQEQKSFADSSLFQTLLWIAIIGGFAAFVIIYLANSNVGLFRRKNSEFRAEGEEDTETDDIFAINYQREIEKAVSKGNYRFAVRLMFLQLLKNLSEKKVIQYKTDRTDFDYLMQLYSTKYYNDFSRIVRDYEYSWYGLFPIEPEQFNLIRKDFENFDNKLKQF